MKLRLDILRRKSSDSEPYLQSILYETNDENTFLSTALTEINSDPEIRDIAGNVVGEIMWERSCLQKKCGSCAMIINGIPSLACNTPLKEFEKQGYIKIEPLKKFPVISDLITDRSIMYENLKNIGAWLDKNIDMSDNERSGNIVFDSSRCLKCGCCLEVCPNFYAGGNFYGMASGITLSRIIGLLESQSKKEITKKYKKNFYEGCGKSLACADICPAGIEIEKLVINSNAAAIWKSLSKTGRDLYEKIK